MSSYWIPTPWRGELRALVKYLEHSFQKANPYGHVRFVGIRAGFLRQVLVDDRAVSVRAHGGDGHAPPRIENAGQSCPHFVIPATFEKVSAMAGLPVSIRKRLDGQRAFTTAPACGEYEGEPSADEAASPTLKPRARLAARRGGKWLDVRERGTERKEARTNKPAR